MDTKIRFVLVAIALMALILPMTVSAHHDPEKGFHSSGDFVITLGGCDEANNCLYSVGGSHQTTHLKGGVLTGYVTTSDNGECDYMIADLVLRGPDPTNALTITGVDSCVGTPGSEEEYYKIDGGLGTFLYSSGEGSFVADSLLSFRMNGRIIYSGNH